MADQLTVMLVGDSHSPHIQRWASSLADEVKVVLVGFDEIHLDRVEFVPLGKRGLSKLRYPLAVPRLAQIIRAVKPNIVHAHFASSYGVCAALASRQSPLVVSAWGSDLLGRPDKHPFHRSIIGWALRQSAAITADSNELLDIAAAHVPRSRRERIVFGPEKSWTQISVSKQPTILSIRQLRPLYNVKAVIESFQKVRARFPDWQLRVMTYGVDPVRAGWPATDGVVWLPALGRDEIRDEMSRASLVVSVPSWDGTAASLLESMALGAVPIVSDLPANREWVKDGHNGKVVGPEVSQLAESISMAIEDRDWRVSAGRCNREIIADGNTWEDSVVKLHMLYRDLARS